MDLTQLEYFRVVARYENITRAAKDLYVSQPTLSQSIARLESSLGIELFDRVNGKLHLNDAGRMFLERVNNAFFELTWVSTSWTAIRRIIRTGSLWPPLSLISSR